MVLERDCRRKTKFLAGSGVYTIGQQDRWMFHGAPPELCLGASDHFPQEHQAPGFLPTLVPFCTPARLTSSCGSPGVVTCLLRVPTPAPAWTMYQSSLPVGSHYTFSSKVWTCLEMEVPSFPVCTSLLPQSWDTQLSSLTPCSTWITKLDTFFF
jgi:hypothetical protein